MKKGWLAAGAAVVLGLAFYFLYWVKTPQYSVGLIREAVQKHDVAKFEKHVNLDKILPRAFDDSLVAQEKLTGEKIQDNPLFAGFKNLIRSGIVPILKEEILNDVKGEKKEIQKTDERYGVIVDKVIGQVNSIHKQYKDVSVESNDGKKAIISIKFYDNQVEKEFSLKFSMVKLEDDTWQIVGVKNFEEYVLEYEFAKKKKLEKLNKPIAEEMAKAVKVLFAKLSIKSDNNPFFATKSLVLKTHLKNIGEKEIKNLTYVVTMVDVTGKVLLETKGVVSNKKFAPGHTMTINGTKELNPFIGNEKTVGDGGYDKSASGISIVKIEYADGSVIEKLTKLPE